MMETISPPLGRTDSATANIDEEPLGEWDMSDGVLFEWGIKTDSEKHIQKLSAFFLWAETRGFLSFMSRIRRR